jgi:hypothetical protein
MLSTLFRAVVAWQLFETYLTVTDDLLFLERELFSFLYFCTVQRILVPRVGPHYLTYLWVYVCLRYGLPSLVDAWWGPVFRTRMRRKIYQQLQRYLPTLEVPEQNPRLPPLPVQHAAFLYQLMLMLMSRGHWREQYHPISSQEQNVEDEEFEVGAGDHSRTEGLEGNAENCEHETPERLKVLNVDEKKRN